MADDEEAENAYLPVYVFTAFFSREAMMYALGDIKFSKPKSLRTMGYCMGLIVLWTVPMIAIIGFDFIMSHLNVYMAVFLLGPPLGIGSVMSKPIFHNKPLLKDLKSIFKYFSQRPIYADTEAYEYDKQNYTVDMNVWIVDADAVADDPSEYKTT